MRRSHPGAWSAREGSGDALARLGALLGRPVALSAILGEKSIPLGDLAAARPGADLLLLPRGEPVRLLADGIDIGEGTAVEVGGRLALRIDRLRPLPAIAAELGGAHRGDPDPVPDSP
jgi:flagellar motor switch/type III secretory pathway protein FliN